METIFIYVGIPVLLVASYFLNRDRGTTDRERAKRRGLLYRLRGLYDAPEEPSDYSINSSRPKPPLSR